MFSLQREASEENEHLENQKMLVDESENLRLLGIVIRGKNIVLGCL